jgi:hypothetical protein
MRPEEKRISFYNRYFIFRKNRNINAKQLKNSFLSYAGLQEEQERAESGRLDEDTERIALEKINRASMPIDVATKPAIAAEILKKKELNESLAAAAAAAPSQRKLTVKARTPKQKEHLEEVAQSQKEKATYESIMANLEMEMSAPIEQIEKNIKKRRTTAGFDPKTGLELSVFLPEPDVNEPPPGMANPLQPSKTLKIVRKMKSSSGAVDAGRGTGTGKEEKAPAGAAAAAATAALPKKTRKKKDDAPKK